MPDLPEVREKFVADTTGYSGKLREAARDADKFGEKNSEAALAARKMGLAASEAADKAARAQKNAADAAEKLARGEISADEAAQAQAKSLREVERASIKAAEAQRAVGKAADQAADNFRQLARDAELAAAAERLGALKAAGATESHNAMLRRLEAKYGDLKGTAVGAFKEIEKEGVQSSKKVASSMISQLSDAAKTIGGTGVLGAIGAGIIALPEIASVAGGGIALALGGALSAIAIKAQLSNKQVQASFAQTKSYVVQQVKQISAPFNNTLLSLSKNAQKAFYDIEPALKSSFDSMAPAITKFGDSFEKSIGKLNPAIRSVGSAFSAVLGSLGDRLPSIMNNFGTSVKAITDAVAANPGAITGLVDDISKLARVTGDSLGMMIRFKDELTGLSGAYDNFKAAITGSDTALKIGSGSFATFGQQAALAAGTTHGFMTSQQAATLTSQQLAGALRNLTSATQGAFDAETQYRQALVAANAQAKQNNAGINGMGKAALANRQALSSLAGAIKNVMTTSHPTAAAIESMRARFVQAAVGMHMTRAAAEALATKLLGVTHAANTIPSSKHTTVSSNAAAAASQIRSYQNWINSLHGKTVYVHTVYTASGSVTFGAGNRKLGNKAGGYLGYAGGGQIQQYPDGGYIQGPGTGTSDSIPIITSTGPIMGSNGEYMINAEQTEKYRPLLDAINYKLDGFASGGLLDGYAKGGKAKPPTKAQKARAAATRSRALSRPEEIAALAAQRSLAAMRSSMFGGFSRGGRAGIGSVGSTVVQHVTTINVNVAGSIRSDQDIAKIVQKQLITNRMPVNLPAGR